MYLKRLEQTCRPTLKLVHHQRLFSLTATTTPWTFVYASFTWTRLSPNPKVSRTFSSFLPTLRQTKLYVNFRTDSLCPQVRSVKVPLLPRAHEQECRIPHHRRGSVANQGCIDRVQGLVGIPIPQRLGSNRSRPSQRRQRKLPLNQHFLAPLFSWPNWRAFAKCLHWRSRSWRIAEQPLYRSFSLRSPHQRQSPKEPTSPHFSLYAQVCSSW